MNDDLMRRIQANPRFTELVSKRSRFSWKLSLTMLAIYYGFILVVAFDPKLLGTSLAGGTVTLGIPVGIFVIVSAFVLTGIYVRRANSEFDALNRQIVEEAQQ
ncbi:DUF485 domain-containing protein [Parachitinimonas caeni]|uniref:DUF485 domain-containing protein n=1 Tax=Parachitinimonas caeni TaxID=3031301 RepID=A0ABT7DZ76_9NEIS|nr:DUF485 domain-containing protein [Parachitinimonas caeni]MDK2125353.1 DUF485 domain-containing protein [Parachitinimonas caeni]